MAQTTTPGTLHSTLCNTVTVLQGLTELSDGEYCPQSLYKNHVHIYTPTKAALPSWLFQYHNNNYWQFNPSWTTFHTVVQCNSCLEGAPLAQWEQSPPTNVAWVGFQTWHHMWVQFVGSLLYTERFFSGYSGFPLYSKTNIWIVNFSLKCPQLVLQH